MSRLFLLFLAFLGLQPRRFRTGRLAAVKNMDRKSHAEAPYYLLTYVQLGSGDPVPILLTPNDFSVARLRAQRNPEDCRRPSFLTRRQRLDLSAGL